MSIVSQSENLSTPIVIQGKLQAPSSSSASRGWRGLVLQTFPGIVFLCDQTELAVERGVADAILVRVQEIR